MEELLETHFEMATRLEDMAQMDTDKTPLIFAIRYENEGRGGLYGMAKELATRFNEQYKDVVWGEDLDWIDTIETFLNENL